MSSSYIPHSRPTIGIQEAQAAYEAVLSGFIGTGEKVHELERALSHFTGRRFAIAASSGSAALYLALRLAGVRTGDSVVLPAFVCRAVLNVLIDIGVQPILADIDQIDLNLSFAAAKQAVAANTKLILVPHMFGAPADIEGFLNLGIPVIEDAASSFGATYRMNPVGSFGIVSIVSFAPTKMVTSGYGGVLLTDDPQIAKTARNWLDYDAVLTSARLADYEVGHNYNLTDLQAAVGLVQMSRLPTFIQRRRAIASYYSRELSGISGVRLPGARSECQHAYYRYVLLVETGAKRIVECLQESGIDARTSVSHFLYDYLGLLANNFPNCESIRQKIVSLPVYPELGDDQVDYIAKTCRSLLGGLK